MNRFLKPVLAFAFCVTSIAGYAQKTDSIGSRTWVKRKDGAVIHYTPLKVDDKTISLFGRKVILADSGLPDKIQSFFNPDVTGMNDTAKNILGENIHFHIVNAATHKDIAFKNTGLIFTAKEPALVNWTAGRVSDFLQMDITGSIVPEGSMVYTVKLTALTDVDLDDTKFHIPFDKKTAKELDGLGHWGGTRPDTVKWKWDPNGKNYDSAWIGEANGGLSYFLHDENFKKPTVAVFYQNKTLDMPVSWGNGGKGGGIITIKGSTMLSETTTGPRSMKKGDVLYYNFSLRVTPDRVYIPAK
jgi:hypothetical protein